MQFSIYCECLHKRVAILIKIKYCEREDLPISRCFCSLTSCREYFAWLTCACCRQEKRLKTLCISDDQQHDLQTTNVEALSLFTTIMSCESTRTPIVQNLTQQDKCAQLGRVNKSKWETAPKLRVAFQWQLDDHLNCQFTYLLPLLLLKGADNIS